MLYFRHFVELYFGKPLVVDLLVSLMPDSAVGNLVDFDFVTTSTTYLLTPLLDLIELVVEPVVVVARERVRYPTDSVVLVVAKSPD